MKPLFLSTVTFFIISFSIVGQVTAKNEPAKRKKNLVPIQFGIASYYHNKFQDRLTATGEKFDQKKMTAAHNGLPLNTWIHVTNRRNQKWVIVRINDRLHAKNKRIVDLSRAAAARLGYLSRGLAPVKVEVLGMKKPPEPSVKLDK